jgi:hypothetical protein
MKYTRESAGRSGREKGPIQATGRHDIDCVTATASQDAAHIRPLLNCRQHERCVGNIAARPQNDVPTFESARNELGITISYWESLEAIRAWKVNSDHLIAQKYGREKWYSAFKTRIALVERDYGMNA